MYEWKRIEWCPVPFKGDFELQFKDKVGHIYSGEISKEWGPEFVEVSNDGTDKVAIAPTLFFEDWRFLPNEKGETDDR